MNKVLKPEMPIQTKIKHQSIIGSVKRPAVQNLFTEGC